MQRLVLLWRGLVPPTALQQLTLAALSAVQAGLAPLAGHSPAAVLGWADACVAVCAFGLRRPAHCADYLWSRQRDDVAAGRVADWRRPRGPLARVCPVCALRAWPRRGGRRPGAPGRCGARPRDSVALGRVGLNFLSCKINTMKKYFKNAAKSKQINVEPILLF